MKMRTDLPPFPAPGQPWGPWYAEMARINEEDRKRSEAAAQEGRKAFARLLALTPARRGSVH